MTSEKFLKGFCSSQMIWKYIKGWKAQIPKSQMHSWRHSWGKSMTSKTRNFALGKAFNLDVWRYEIVSSWLAVMAHQDILSWKCRLLIAVIGYSPVYQQLYFHILYLSVYLLRKAMCLEHSREHCINIVVPFHSSKRWSSHLWTEDL